MTVTASSSALFVGITSWNSGDFLPLCIGSLQESVPEAEILVLDNFSSDGSADLARSLGARVRPTVVCLENNYRDPRVWRAMRRARYRAFARIGQDEVYLRSGFESARSR